MTGAAIVTCDSYLYANRDVHFRGVSRLFINIPANGIWSVFHDFVAFFRVFFKADFVFIMGVSGGPWFPIFRALADCFQKKIIINIDGVEWRRSKFSRLGRIFLRIFDWLAQRCSHLIIYDNEGLKAYILEIAREKSIMIPYGGDHVIRRPDIPQQTKSALTICRIEPENNLEMLIEGYVLSELETYTIIGNWTHSDYARALREKYAGVRGLTLLDPIYDPHKLSEHRERCEFYLHGHSVGGTNPSLVEMLFYRKKIICFDVSFNRYTAGALARYFCCSNSLAKVVENFEHITETEEWLLPYRNDEIARQYLALCD